MLDCCVNSIHSSVSFSIRSRCYADRIASALWTDACRVLNKNLQHNSKHQSHSLFNWINIVCFYCIKWLYSFIVPKLIHYPFKCWNLEHPMQVCDIIHWRGHLPQQEEPNRASACNNIMTRSDALCCVVMSIIIYTKTWLSTSFPTSKWGNLTRRYSATGDAIVRRCTDRSIKTLPYAYTVTGCSRECWYIRSTSNKAPYRLQSANLVGKSWSFLNLISAGWQLETTKLWGHTHHTPVYVPTQGERMKWSIGRE